MSLDDYMKQPNFTLHPERSIIPVMPLPQNFREAVQKFYQEGKRERIEQFAMAMKRSFPGRGLDLRLKWDDSLGLTDVNISSQAAIHLDPDNDEFVEHNLGPLYSLIAMAIFLKYRAELIRYG